MRVWLLLLLASACAEDRSFHEEIELSAGTATSFTLDGQTSGAIVRDFSAWEDATSEPVLATFADGTTPTIDVYAKCEERTFDSGGPFDYRTAHCSLALTEHMIVRFDLEPGSDTGPGFTGTCDCIDVNGLEHVNDVTMNHID